VLRHLLAVVLVGADELPLWQADMRYLMSIARKLAAQNVTAIMPAEPPESVGT
jgi:hypothetical protein